MTFMFYRISFCCVFPSHLIYFSLRMESLETVLQIMLPVEKESLLLCGSDLLFLHEMAIQEFHLTNADGIYQNLRVKYIYRVISSSEIYIC